MTRTGILGGTFNPPHLGHLVCAQEAHAQLGLDTVVLMPARTPPHKEVADDPGAEERLELCRLAAAGDERLSVSRLELDRPGPSYTADTLAALREQTHGRDELVWIVGGDMARSLPAWHAPERVLELATLAVADRAGAERAEIERAVAPVAGAGRIAYFAMPRIDVSSSMVRARVPAGLPVRYLVPDAVADFIARRGLYRSVAVAPA